MVEVMSVIALLLGACWAAARHTQVSAPPSSKLDAAFDAHARREG